MRPRPIPLPQSPPPARRRTGGTPPPPPPGTEVALRLAIGRDGVGLELAQPVRLGCLRATDLSVALPAVRFPVDVSGGVARFRHRRGELRRLEVEIEARAVEPWAAPRLRGLVGPRSPQVWVGVRPAGALVCISAPPEPDETNTPSVPVLAFDVHALAEGTDLVLVVHQARGADLPSTPTALAIACLEALLGRLATRQGAAFVVARGADAIARALLPEAGARAPSTARVRWTTVAAASDTWVLQAVLDAVAAAPSEDAVRTREAALLLRETDDALVRGEEEAARAFALQALERAPRHPEIARRIVDIDARTQGRTEAALALLRDALGARQGTAAASPAPSFGTTPGELLAEAGDIEAALASLERAGEADPAPWLGARAFEIAARTTHDPEQAAAWLDKALARAPRSVSARWLRVAKRLALGRLEDAIADVEHLEALARGGRAKHVVWLRAGTAWQEARLASHAGTLFERALRFAPDEPRALAGLGAALASEGRATRGVAVLERAARLAEAHGEPTGPILLDLARALAEKLDDLPTAVARVGAIPIDAREAPIARGLEGRWRARLGDLAGATLCFARLRELAMSFPLGAADPRGGPMAALLKEAADFASVHMNDPLAAQRHLAAALRLRPRDAELRRDYRAIGESIARRDAEPVADDFEPIEDPASGAPAAHPIEPDWGRQSPQVEAGRPQADPIEPISLEPEADPEVAGRIDELTRRLQADARDDAVADELASLLERAGRGHELLALLSARVEDASPEKRAELMPRTRAALERLAADADRAGRRDEASLYRGALASLSG
jgi:tetratricopeptide (TPR) repeat protein